jgi:hypothetical protein
MTSGSGDPHVLEPGHAPTPFTAAGIRQGCTRGRTVRLLVESVGGEPFVRVIRFVECDEDGATLETLRLSVDGEALGPPTPHRTSWVALQAHASYPDEQTAVAAETSRRLSVRSNVSATPSRAARITRRRRRARAASTRPTPRCPGSSHPA